MTRPSIYLIPSTDIAEFSQLPEGSRLNVIKWLAVIANLETAECRRDEAKRIAHDKGTSPQRVLWWHRHWKRAMDWRIFVLSKDIALPAAFVRHWEILIERHQRRGAAHRALIHAWKRGHDIPGYDTPPPAGPTGIPKGWSYRNLLRLILSDPRQTQQAKGFYLK